MSQKIIDGELKKRIRALERAESDRDGYKKSTVLLNPLFENHDSIMLLIEPESGAIIDANSAAQNFYGYTKEALKQMKIQNINILPSDEIATKRHEALTEELNNFEFQHRLSNGEIRMVEVHSSPIVIEDEKILFSIIHDITKRVEAEDALLKSEEKFRFLYYTTPDAVNINRLADGLYIDVNEEFLKLTGYSREDVIGKTSLELQIWNSPADRQKLVEILRKDGVCENIEAKFKMKDGTILTGLISASILELGGVTHIVSVTKNIDKQKHIQKEKEALISKLQAALAEVKTLSGLLPICSHCKKIRDDKGYWNQLESYVEKHSDALFSHSICPECTQKFYGDEEWYSKIKDRNRKD